MADLYLPLAIAQGNSSPLISGRARYATPRRGEDTTLSDMLLQIATAYQLPGTWIDVDVSTFDYFAETGEVTWLGNPLGLPFNEMELTYTAGFARDFPDPIKFACGRDDCLAQCRGRSGAGRENKRTEPGLKSECSRTDSGRHCAGHAGALCGTKGRLTCLILTLHQSNS